MYLFMMYVHNSNDFLEKKLSNVIIRLVFFFNFTYFWNFQYLLFWLKRENCIERVTSHNLINATMHNSFTKLKLRKLDPYWIFFEKYAKIKILVWINQKKQTFRCNYIFMKIYTNLHLFCGKISSKKKNMIKIKILKIQWFFKKFWIVRCQKYQFLV